MPSSGFRHRGPKSLQAFSTDANDPAHADVCAAFDAMWIDYKD